jgi:molybdopterin converting factor small subunit
VTIEVKLFATLRLKVGRGTATIETERPITVRALLDLVSEAVGEDVTPFLVDGNSIITGTMILIGGVNIIHLDGLDTLVDAHDVAIFPPAGGG